MGFTDVKKQYIELVEAEKSKYENPNLQLNNKKMVICDRFYNICNKVNAGGVGFENIASYIGEDSPVKYDKIYDVVMFGLNAQERTKEEDPEKGFVYREIFESVIMGNTFEPYEGSMFTLMNDNGYYIYQITFAEEILDKDRSAYRIQFEKYTDILQDQFSYIDKQVVEEFKYIYENVGFPDKKVVVPMTAYNEFVNTANTIKYLQNEYIKAFYKKMYKTICCEKDGKDFYYSPALIEFVSNTNCLYDEGNAINLYFTHETIVEQEFRHTYKDTLYYKASDRGLSSYDKKDLTYSILPYDLTNIFSFFNKVNGKNVYIIDKDPNTLKMIDLQGLSSVKDMGLFLGTPEDKDKSAYTIYDNMWSIVDNVEGLIKLFDGYEIDESSISDYMLIPFVIYVLKNKGLRKQVTTKYSDSILNLLGL